MMFLFKPKPIYIDCFTANASAHEYAPIQLANHFIPEWWKQLPKSFNLEYEKPHPPLVVSTMRRCAGFVNIYSRGLMLPLWSDLSIKATLEGVVGWRYADRESNCDSHYPQEVGPMLEEANVTHIKIVSPWTFYCKENVQWYFTQPIWNHKVTNDFYVPSGIINYKYQGTTHINIFIRRQDHFFTIEHGTPMAHIVPLSDRPIKIKNHLLSKEEYQKKNSLHRPVFFENSYYKKMRLTQDKESKCPFNF